MSLAYAPGQPSWSERAVVGPLGQDATQLRFTRLRRVHREAETFQASTITTVPCVVNAPPKSGLNVSHSHSYVPGAREPGSNMWYLWFPITKPKNNEFQVR